ncbi:MAG: YfcE family phosphodiesterase [Clostridia bacterium]|nr:YfcE family phosphodiesterase [Clostridia bacterium]
MRILVFSDSHGRTSQIEKAIEAQPEAKHIFFLGDCVRDIEDYPFIYTDRTFHIVSGNCDYSSTYKSADTAVVGGKKIFFTHGHHLSVKSGIGRLKQMALVEGASIVLYGHTHVANKEYADGIHFVNPGSLSSAREGSTGYAVIDIESNGIMPILIKI